MALNVEHDDLFYQKLKLWEAAEIKDKNTG